MAINSRFGIGIKGIVFRILVILIVTFNISFIKKLSLDHSAPKAGKMKVGNSHSVEQNIVLLGERKNSFPSVAIDLNHSFSTYDLNITLPFFRVVYFGNGVDHMSINLVNLNSTGLQVGDEIGIFDSIYCVGSAVISEKNLLSNGLSIPASANDTISGSQNGYIEGDQITLKLYRSGKIYKLNFELVNNSRDIFEKWGSMFAFVNFTNSTGFSMPAILKSINIYPNPFTETININITLSRKQYVNCEILDSSGNIVRTLFQGEADIKIDLIWNAKDNEDRKVTSGIYFCRINDTTTKIIYQSVANQY